MRTIEFIVGHSGGKRQYEARYSSQSRVIKKMQNSTFSTLLLRTIGFLSENNPAKEPIEVRLPRELPGKYKRWLRTSFTQYAGHKSVVVLYPSNKGKQERLWEWQ